MPKPSNLETNAKPQVPLSVIEAELARFEEEERKRLGLDQAPKQKQWKDTVNRAFYADQRAHTTILVSGLTMAHDLFVKAGLTGLGYTIKALDCPDNDALQTGKEYGNRGQCNPTYFTVGNLVKHLINLRDKEGMSTEDIVDKHVFLTAGGCGPCRFGMYVTEYRKALTDAGFPNFRVMLFEPNGGMHQATGQEVGLKMDKGFFLTLAKAIFVGDALNAIMYRIRPYEVEKGATDKAVEQCRELIMKSLSERKGLLKSLRQCKKILQAVKVDKTLVKPKVSIIGEFWAMTTEGEGNYRLQRFLEEEGAEVDIQLIAGWILYNVWQSRVDTRSRMVLKKADVEARKGLKTTQVAKKFLTLWVAEMAVRLTFKTFAWCLGLKNYKLPDMEENARVAAEHYNTELRGGEGHMEVGKLIQNVIHKKAHMTISVKPFGCMPSSGVSDGVQSVITERYPEAIFLPIETSGDGAVNVYSRIQMMLFKAKRAAEEEYETLLKNKRLSVEKLRAKLGKHAKLQRATHYSPHVVAGTAANLVVEVA
ncbi:MAG: 2-hydroxyglutaryl-CoA dehydratase [Deltaproteobacteria bacterium]|nr:2-hydroxyglutaryl-CoA dehydratase [Deltaproteobacteria bacterium]